jgi:hypothetical protein
VIDAATLHALIEFILGLVLESLPLLDCGMTMDRDWGEHLCSVGEEKSVAYIEEDDAPLWHLFILLKASVSASLRFLGQVHNLELLTAKFAKNGREGREEKHRAA